MTKHSKVIPMVIVAVAVLGLAAFSVSAEAPSGTPPTCPTDNPACNPPINVSTFLQVKQGSLGILGNFTVGTVSSPKKASIVDTLEVRRTLDGDSLEVISVNPPKASTAINGSISTLGNLDLIGQNSTAASNVYVKNSSTMGANLVVSKGAVQSIQAGDTGSLILGNNNAKVWSPWVSSLHFSVFPDVKGGTGQMAFSFEGNGSTEGRKFMMQKDFFRPMEDNYATLGIPFARWKNVYSVGADVGNITIRGGNPALNKILASDAVGLASWKTAAELGLDSGSGVSNWTLTGTNLTNNNTTGNVGIGITPTARLHVNGSVKVGQKNPLEMGAGLSKESSAGKIAYQLFSSGLDIVGAGTVNGSRLVKLWDNVEVPSTITTNNLKAVNLCTTAGACASVQNIINGLSSGGSNWTLVGTNLYNKNAGNVGIGISTPVSKLTVNGNIRGMTFQSITGSDTGVLTFGSNVNAKVLAPWINALHFSVSPGKAVGTGAMDFYFGGDGVMTGRKYFLNATAFRPADKGGATLGIPNAPWGTLYSTSADVSGQVTIRGGNPGANKILTSDATGLATWKTAAELGLGGSGDFYCSAKYDINGDLKVTSEDTAIVRDCALNACTSAQLQRSDLDGDGKVGAVDEQMSVNSVLYCDSGDSNWTLTGTNLSNNNTGNVGIGTTDPSTKLHVNGGLLANGKVAIVDGTQGLNKVLVSDANGLASWKTAREAKLRSSELGTIGNGLVKCSHINYRDTYFSCYQPKVVWITDVGLVATAKPTADTEVTIGTITRNAVCLALGGVSSPSGHVDPDGYQASTFFASLSKSWVLSPLPTVVYNQIDCEYEF